MPEGQSKATRRRRHPGGGGRKRRFESKGRQVEAEALGEVRALLGDGERRRDLLIEYLHLIQDRYSHLGHRHLAALAAELRLPMAEVYETATFYAHFDVIREGAEAPPALTVRVCDGLSCALAGAEDLLAALPDALGTDVRVLRAPCVGRCDRAPVAKVGKNAVALATIETVRAAVSAGATTPMTQPFIDFDAYRAAGADDAAFHYRYPIGAALQQAATYRDYFVQAIVVVGAPGHIPRVSYRDRQYGYEFSSFNGKRGLPPIELILVEQAVEVASDAEPPPRRYRLTTFEEALPGAFSAASFMPEAVERFLDERAEP